MAYYVLQTENSYHFFTKDDEYCEDFTIPREIRSNTRRFYKIDSTRESYGSWKYVTIDDHGVMTAMRETEDAFPEGPGLSQAYLRISNDPVREDETYQVLEKEIQQTNKPFQRVANIVMDHAVKTGAFCSISMDPITPENSICVAPCYHIFKKESIQEWLKTSDRCPECRTSCGI